MVVTAGAGQGMRRPQRVQDFSCARQMRSAELMCSLMTVVNNTVHLKFAERRIMLLKLDFLVSAVPRRRLRPVRLSLPHVCLQPAPLGPSPTPLLLGFSEVDGFHLLPEGVSMSLLSSKKQGG